MREDSESDADIFNSTNVLEPLRPAAVATTMTQDSRASGLRNRESTRCNKQIGGSEFVSPKMKILLVDDHDLFREGLRLILKRLGSQWMVLEAGSAEEGLALGVAEASLGLVLLDLNLPGVGGVDGVHQFRQRFPDCPLIMLSGSDDHQLVQDGIAAGARAFIHKSSTPDEMLGVMHGVLEQGNPTSAWHSSPVLTPRQIEVLAQLCAGNSNKQIARELGMSGNTVRVHLHDIFRVLGVSTRTQAAMLAKDRGMV